MQWVLKNIPKEDEEYKFQLAKELGISKTLAHLLVLRGIKTFEQARLFFRPSLDHLHSPFLMHDMDKAIERLYKSIINKRKNFNLW